MSRLLSSKKSKLSLLLSSLILCSFISAQYAFADDQEEQKKKKNDQGLPLPNFDFLFGNKKKQSNQNSQEPEIKPAFPITSRKKNYAERNNNQFADQQNEFENPSSKRSNSDNSEVYPGLFDGMESANSKKNQTHGKHAEVYSSADAQNQNKKKSNQAGNQEIYPGAYDENGKKRKKNNQEGNQEIYPGSHDEKGKKRNKNNQAGNQEIYPGVYDENGKKRDKNNQAGNQEIYPGVYDENGKKKRDNQTGNLQLNPGVYDDDGKKKKDNRTVDIYSSVYDEKDKKNKKAGGPVDVSPYLYDEDGKKKKRNNNGTVQLNPYNFEDNDNKKKDKTANGGKIEIYPGTGGTGGTGNGTDDGWNGHSPWGSQGVLNTTGLGGIGGIFNPSRVGVPDRWGQGARGTGATGNRTLRRFPLPTRRPIITMPGGPGTGGFTELEKPIIEDPFKTSISPSASGNPGQVANFAKQCAYNERDISPGQSMWSTTKAQMPAFGDRSGTMASCFHQKADVGCQPNSIPGVRGVSGSENKVSERLGDISEALGFNQAGSDNDAANTSLMKFGRNSMAQAMENRPHQKMQEGQAQGMGQTNLIADAAAELGHDQGAQAMTYVGSYLKNFTSAGGNKWNQIRDQIFVPMGILLLLPGAMFTQVRAIMAQGNPVLGQAHPFEGILRSLVALFFIPGSYLVMNYGIDISNSLTFTIAEQYTRLFGSDMYNDAMCHEIKAMPFRLPEENRNTIDLEDHSMGQILVARDRGPFSQLEANLLAVKIWDPCDGLYIVPADRCQEVVPVPVMACRMACNLTNASLLTSWNILCAFQCAYLYFLWCMGPVVAGLWTWPMKQFRDAFPNWVEGVLAVCFWALFWNATVLIIALVRRDYETGTIIMIALNTLGNISVKFAFDFAGLIKSAGDEAMQFGDKLAEKAGNAGGKQKSPNRIKS